MRRMRRNPPTELAARHGGVAIAAELERREQQQREWEAALRVCGSVMWGPDEAKAWDALKLAAELQTWRYERSRRALAAVGVSVPASAA